MEVLNGGGLGCVPVEKVVGRSTVNADGLAYTFLVGPSAPGAPVALTFNGAGIVINAGSATIANQGLPRSVGSALPALSPSSTRVVV
jgi:hypothetical protein